MNAKITTTECNPLLDAIISVAKSEHNQLVFIGRRGIEIGGKIWWGEWMAGQNGRTVEIRYIPGECTAECFSILDGFSIGICELLPEYASTTTPPFGDGTAYGKIIHRFLNNRCNAKLKMLEQGESEADADSMARRLFPESQLEDALKLSSLRAKSYALLRSHVKQIVEEILGEPAPVEFECYRYAESRGGSLKPYQSLSAKLAASRNEAAPVIIPRTVTL